MQVYDDIAVEEVLEIVDFVHAHFPSGVRVELVASEGNDRIVTLVGFEDDESLFRFRRGPRGWEYERF